MVNTSDRNSKNRFLPFKENIPQKILAATFQYVLFQWKKHKIVGSNSKSKTLLSNKELQKYSLKWEVTCPAAECLRPTPTFPWEQLFHPRSGWFIKLNIFDPRSCWFIKEDKFFFWPKIFVSCIRPTVCKVKGIPHRLAFACSWVRIVHISQRDSISKRLWEFWEFWSF